MIITLQEMKDYLGLTGTEYDSFLTEQITVVNSAIEGYCGRKFDLTSYTQTLYKDDRNIYGGDGSYIYTYHYPVTSVTSITDEDGEVYDLYRIINDRGRITKENESFRKEKWFTCYNKLTIVYEAGYAQADMPPVLKQVIYSLVSEAYNKKVAGIDVGFGNNVQRISVAGVMSVDFDYSLNNNERENAYGAILKDWLNVLDDYRSERAVIGEIEENYVS